MQSGGHQQLTSRACLRDINSPSASYSKLFVWVGAR